MKVIILVGGKGEKMWPYNEIRNKCMIPISNRPIIDYLVEGIFENNIHEITIVGSQFMDEIRHFYRHDPRVQVIITPQANGNAKTLMQVIDSEDFVFFYGDCILRKEDISQILNSPVHSVLLTKARDDCHHHIIADVKDGNISSFIGHPRGYDEGYFMVAGHFDERLYHHLYNNRGRFKNTKVGVGSPNEKFIEESLNDFIEELPIKALLSQEVVFDLDKPWQVLEANAYMNRYLTSNLHEHHINQSAFIHETAQIDGFIQLGKNSKIGRNVHIKGNVIIGDDTIIDQGAVIEEGCVIGNECKIINHCKIGSFTTIGNDCIIEHTAEIIGGLIMDKNYLYHHGEFFGLCGERCDLGAGSICGTLRFDDGETTHTINGRKEIPLAFSNATYLGDYTRAGVGVIFLPGVMVGCHCVVGAGTILNKTVKSNTLIYPKQELIEKEWSYKKYGW